MKHLTKRKSDRSGLWFGVVVFGLFGQIAWVIENMYLNVYLYKTITFDLTATSAMVAASAIVATLTTLFMGVLSDKIGKRKLFMSVGYIIWGFTVMAFAAISTSSVKVLFPNANAVVAATVLIVVMDCVMTFFGSTANDAAFNSWVTDNTTNKNRGRVEGVLQMMPLIAMLVVFGALDGLTQEGNWTLFFVIVGASTTLAGICGLFFVRDSKSLKKKEGAYFKDIFYGFRPSTVKKNGILYVIFFTMCLIQIGNNIFIPYLMIYLEYFLGYSNYVFLLGGVILGASAVSVVFGLLADKIDKRILFLPAFLLYICGGTGMIFARSTVAVGFGGFALMAGNLSLLVLLSSLVRIHTPEKKVGLFQGIRMVFTVLVPMCVGPFIGAFVSSTSNAVYTDPTTGAVQPVPSNDIFLAAAIVVALAIIPVLFMTLYKKGFLWKKGAASEEAAELLKEEDSQAAEAETSKIEASETEAAETVETVETSVSDEPSDRD